MGLEDMTAKRADGEAVKVVVENAMEYMQLEADQTVALVTDDPTMMRKTRRRWEETYPFAVVRALQLHPMVMVLTDASSQTFACVLHLSNTGVGHVCAHPSLKEVISHNIKIVTFFRSSHYWGGQLLMVAEGLGVSEQLQTHSDSRWYTLVLQAMSIRDFRCACFHYSTQP